MGVVNDANDIDTIEIITTYKHGTNGHASEPNSAIISPCFPEIANVPRYSRLGLLDYGDHACLVRKWKLARVLASIVRLRIVSIFRWKLIIVTFEWIIVIKPIRQLIRRIILIK